MEPWAPFDRIVASLERSRIQPEPPEAGRRAVGHVLFGDEVAASTRLAGSPLCRPEVAALLGRGIALGEHRLEAYILVADYAAAAAYVRDAPERSGRRPFLRSDEIVDLHALATRRSASDGPGGWRARTLAPFPSGMVAPPPWLVPREMASFVERLAGGPAAGVAPLYWVAAAHARFERIHPFTRANGRVGRLIANLLLRRLGYPPLIISGREAVKYLAALRDADARRPWPLATLFAASVRASLLRSAEAAGDLVPLAELAAPGEMPALYKAAERGRLATLRRAGTLLSTQAWLDQYRTSTRRRGGSQPEAGVARRNIVRADAPRDSV